MTADPNFISLVDTNRFQSTTENNITSPKAQARLKQQQKNYSNESISLRLVPPPSTSSLQKNNDDIVAASESWNIPRFRLTESFLSEVVNRGRPSSSPKLIVSHIVDAKSKTVILPSQDMQSQCRSYPVVYDVIVHVAGGIKQGGVLLSSSFAGESLYKGDLIFHITNVPKLSKSEQFAVLALDVHRWLIQGAISSVDEIRIATNKVDSLKQTLEQLHKTLANIHASPIYNDNGRAIVGSPLKVAREIKMKSLHDEIEQTKKSLAEAEQSLEAANERHFEACSLTITEYSDESGNGKSNKISFLVKLTGKKKQKEYYTNLITNKTDWCLVPMYASGDLTDKNMSTSSLLLSIDESELSQHFVDVGNVSIVLLPDGFGVHEAYDENDAVFSTNTNTSDGIVEDSSKGRHMLYHGHFKGGEYREGTLHTDAGVFSGTFQSNEPSCGKMKYSDGTIITGNFTLPPSHKGDRVCNNEEEEADESPLGPNPYRLGLPHNNVSIQFKDGASYEGTMHHGVVTGEGIYRYAGGTIQGNFVNGILQNNDGVEGQGGSNMLGSLMMFDGERLWGP